MLPMHNHFLPPVPSNKSSVDKCREVIQAVRIDVKVKFTAHSQFTDESWGERI